MSAIRIHPTECQGLFGGTRMCFPFSFAGLHCTNIAIIPDFMARSCLPSGAGALTFLKRLGIGRFLFIRPPVRDWCASVYRRIISLTFRFVISSPIFKSENKVWMPCKQITLADVLIVPVSIKALKIKNLLKFIAIRVSFKDMQCLLIVLTPKFAPFNISSFLRPYLGKFLSQSFITMSCFINIKRKLRVKKIIVEVRCPESRRSSFFKPYIISHSIKCDQISNKNPCKESKNGY